MTSRELVERIRKLEQIIGDCTLCPRECRVDRTAGEKGYCKTGEFPFVSSWGPHFGEERPLVGRSGSGTIFFGNCNLGCIFCQNYSISHLGEGREISHGELAGYMISLQESGCHNINLVTPTHQVAAILKGFEMARDMGLRVPMVYNCGGYESVDTLKLLEGVIDIYMPDFKYADGVFAAGFSDAPDYPDRAKAAIREMHRQVGDLILDGKGIAKKGLLVRHLVLPSGVAGTNDFVLFIAEEISKDTYVNIMDQYNPCYKAFGHFPLDRRISEQEYSDAISCAVAAGLKRIDGVTI